MYGQVIFFWIYLARKILARPRTSSEQWADTADLIMSQVLLSVRFFIAYNHATLSPQLLVIRKYTLSLPLEPCHTGFDDDFQGLQTLRGVEHGLQSDMGSGAEIESGDGIATASAQRPASWMLSTFLRRRSAPSFTYDSPGHSPGEVIPCPPVPKIARTTPATSTA